MRIEVLYFDGCPNHEALLPRLREILAHAGVCAIAPLRARDDLRVLSGQGLAKAPPVPYAGGRFMASFPTVREAVICEPLRTAVGGFGGVFRDMRPAELAATVIRELLRRTSLPRNALCSQCAAAAG